MHTEHALAAIAADGGRLIEVAANLDAVVPTCPEWTTHDLLGHIGWVHRYVAEHVAQRAPERISPELIEVAPEGEAVREYAQSSLAILLEAIGDVDPSEPLWTWSDRQDAGFFIRRMVHETAIHRYDAEGSVGDTTGVDDDQGADGIDELYGDVLVFGLRQWPRPVPTESLHLHRTDGGEGEGEWMLRAEGDAIALSHGHEKGDAAVRGSGGDLFLAMWGRLPIDRLEVFGDEAVVRSWTDLSP